MHYNKSTTQNRSKVQDKRVLFVLHEDLLNQLRECAAANHVSVSAFVRESIRLNLKAHMNERHQAS